MYMIHKIIIIVAVIAVGSVLSISLANATLFNNSPQKPELGLVTNPDIIVAFDELYSKYPNISQADVNQAHRDASYACASAAAVETKDRTAFTDLIQLSFCQGFMGGMMEDYLDALGIAYYQNEESTSPPILQ